MTLIVRFLGDPIGYAIDWDSSDRPHGWLWANVGTGERRVRINVDRAYKIYNLVLDAGVAVG